MKNWLCMLVTCWIFCFISSILSMNYGDVELKNNLHHLGQSLRALTARLEGSKKTAKVVLAPEPEIKKKYPEFSPTKEQIRQAVEGWLRTHNKLSSAPQQAEAREAIEMWADNFALFNDVFNIFAMFEILEAPGGMDKFGEEEVKRIFSESKGYLTQIVPRVEELIPYDLNKNNLEAIFYENKLDQIKTNPHLKTSPPLFHLTQLTLENLQSSYQRFLFSQEADKIKHQKSFRVETEEFWQILDDILGALRRLQKKYGISYKARGY